MSTHCAQANVLQAILQGPRQNFRLPVADFKQAVLDAQNGVQGPGSSGTGLKVRLPMGKGSSVGHASKSKGQPHGARNKPPGQSRFAIHSGPDMLQCRPGLPLYCLLASSQCSSIASRPTRLALQVKQKASSCTMFSTCTMLVLLVNTHLLSDLAHCSGLLGVLSRLCHAGWYVCPQGVC